MIRFGKSEGSAAVNRLALVVLFVTATTLSADDVRRFAPLAGRVDPKAFGIQDDTITTISAWSFSIGTTSDNGVYAVDTPGGFPNLGRYNFSFSNDTHYFAALDLPAGAVIDYIGVNSAVDAAGVMACALWVRDSSGSGTPLAVLSLPPHDWATDLFGPFGILVDTHQNRGYVLEVEQAPSTNYEYLGWVEVWWHRSVSPAPASPTFGDVPTTDVGYQYIEALAASGITGGCGGGNYCPDASLTRRQMAIFLAKALGLHWPY